MERRSECPISCGLELFGDKWTLLVVRDLAFKGKRSFSELLASDEGIATNILSDRLARLEAQGIVDKIRDQNDGRRFHYRLSESGIDLLPVLVEIIVWSAKHDPETTTTASFVSEAKRNRSRLLARLKKALTKG